MRIKHTKCMRTHHGHQYDVHIIQGDSELHSNISGNCPIAKNKIKSLYKHRSQNVLLVTYG